MMLKLADSKTERGNEGVSHRLGLGENERRQKDERKRKTLRAFINHSLHRGRWRRRCNPGPRGPLGADVLGHAADAVLGLLGWEFTTKLLHGDVGLNDNKRHFYTQLSLCFLVLKHVHINRT